MRVALAPRVSVLDAITFGALRLAGQDPLAVRASKKMRNDELLITGFAASRLRMELERIPLWRGDHVAIAQLQSPHVVQVYDYGIDGDTPYIVMELLDGEDLRPGHGLRQRREDAKRVPGRDERAKKGMRRLAAAPPTCAPWAPCTAHIPFT